MGIDHWIIGIGTTTLTGLAVCGGIYLSGVIEGWSFSGGSGASSIPRHHTLYEDSDFAFLNSARIRTVSQVYKGKYGQIYSKFLVGVSSSNIGDFESDNEDWWRWTFENTYARSEPTDDFSKDKITTWELLRDACKDAYKANKTVQQGKLIVEGTSKTYRESDFWNFCSSRWTKIKALRDTANYESYPSNSYGWKQSNRDVLVSTEPYYTDNLFWHGKTQELLVENMFVSDSIFEKLQKKLKGEDEGVEVQPTLREVCREAYGKPESESGPYARREVFKYCSLTGEVSN